MCRNKSNRKMRLREPRLVCVSNLHAHPLISTRSSISSNKVLHPSPRPSHPSLSAELKQAASPRAVQPATSESIPSLQPHWQEPPRCQQAQQHRRRRRHCCPLPPARQQSRPAPLPHWAPRRRQQGLRRQLQQPAARLGQRPRLLGLGEPPQRPVQGLGLECQQPVQGLGMESRQQVQGRPVPSFPYHLK